MKEANISFVSNDGSGYTPVPEGTYPAHVSSFTMNQYNGSYVFNLTFKIADEVSKIDVPIMKKNSSGEYVLTEDFQNASFMKGKEYRTDKGVWLTPNLASGEEWKNKRYKEFFENIGVNFPKDENGGVSLGIVEDKDVKGLPCLVSLKETTFTNKDGETKKSLQVSSIKKWDSGYRISEEEMDAEDLPF